MIFCPSVHHIYSTNFTKILYTESQNIITILTVTLPISYIVGKSIKYGKYFLQLWSPFQSKQHEISIQQLLIKINQLDKVQKKTNFLKC